MATVSAAARRRRSPARKRKKRNPLLVWWPLLLGIAATPVAMHVAGILALEGPIPLRMLYPYVLLVRNIVQHASYELGGTLSQGMMFAQFPLYGLLYSLKLRSKGAGPALNLVVLLHLAGIAAVFALAFLSSH